MMRIAFAWEDTHFLPLKACVDERMRLRPPSATGFPELLHYTLHGNGRFAPHVEDSWPRVKLAGLLLNKGRIEHLVCVADADRLQELLPQIRPRPAEAAEVAAWHRAAETTFETHLRQRATKVDPSTVHGFLLRWSKESLNLAVYDRPKTREGLGIDVSSAPVQAFLKRCSPPPLRIADGLFTDAFRNPVRCLDDLRKAQGLPALGKGAIFDGVLMALDRSDLEVVARRVPDLDRLVTLAWRLSMGADPSSESKTTPETPRARRASRKKR